MEVQTIIHVDERELKQIVSSFFAPSYEVKSVEFEIEHSNHGYIIGGARIIASQAVQEEQ